MQLTKILLINLLIGNNDNANIKYVCPYLSNSLIPFKKSFLMFDLFIVLIIKQRLNNIMINVKSFLKHSDIRLYLSISMIKILTIILSVVKSLMLYMLKTFLI